MKRILLASIAAFSATQAAPIEIAPLTRTTASPAAPGAVAMAAIVSSKVMRRLFSGK